MPDAFGRAIRDHHRGDRTTPLRQGDGEETREHPIGAFYFDAFDAESNAGSWLTSRLSGPLVDLGGGGPARAAVSRAVRDSCGRDQPSTRRGDARPRRRGCPRGRHVRPPRRVRAGSVRVGARDRHADRTGGLDARALGISRRPRVRDDARRDGRDGPHYRAAPGSGRVRSGLRIEDRPPYHAVSAARPWSCADRETRGRR